MMMIISIRGKNGDKNKSTFYIVQTQSFYRDIDLALCQIFIHISSTSLDQCSLTNSIIDESPPGGQNENRHKELAQD